MNKVLSAVAICLLTVACGGPDGASEAFVRELYENGKYADSTFVAGHSTDKFAERENDVPFDSGYRDGIGNDTRLVSVRKSKDHWFEYDAVDRGWEISRKVRVVKKNGNLMIDGLESLDPVRLENRTTELGRGETFIGLMTRLGMGREDANTLLRKCGKDFDVRKMRAGCRVSAYYGPSDDLQYVIYSNTRIRSTVFRCTDSLSLWVYDKPVTIEHKTADVIIRNSLWADMVHAGAPAALISDLSEIYAWTINFFSLREGDRFRVVYDQKVCEGEVIGIEKVAYAVYDSGKFRSTAVYFDQGDGGNKYWNEKGESMRKAFLKAPLKYNRISSKFSYHRVHPVTGKVRPHTGVDYAAPTGTPVHSIGDGTVILCGWDKNGGGNRIKVRHMNGYETAYLHLSRFASGIKVGSRVAQGQTIGYVGSTGRSTGPHLDFRVWKDKTPIDPLKMISPPSQPLNKANMEELSKLVEKYNSELGI